MNQNRYKKEDWRHQKQKSHREETKLEQWIKKDLPGHIKSKKPEAIKELVKGAKETACAAEKAKTNQIRRLYGPVIKIQERLNSLHRTSGESSGEWERELAMLKPRAVYAAAREKELKLLKEAIVKSIEAIEALGSQGEGKDKAAAGEMREAKKTAAKNFCAFMEAVVAYHKFFHRKKN